MRLDPSGFTGPPTSNDQSNGNDDSSSSNSPYELPPRDPIAARIPFSRYRLCDDLQERSRRGKSSSCWLHDRVSSPIVTTIAVAAAAAAANDDDDDDDDADAATVCYWFESVKDGPETRNATAFHVSYGSVSRSEGRASVRAFPNILEEKRPVPLSRRCNDHDACRESGGAKKDEGDDHSGNENARTRWKKARGRAVLGKSRDLSRIPTADATNAPFVDAFVHTAHNDVENGDDRDVDVARAASFREIGNESRREESKTRRDDSEEKKVENVCDERLPRLVREKKRSPKSWDRCSRSLRRERPRFVGARERCESDYTARFQEPITNGSRCYDDELAINGPTKVSNSRGRKYGLLFILYLLAWPLVCSTNPSGQFAPDFAQSPSLGFAENLSQHNVSQISSLLSANAARQQQQHQQQQQQHQQQQHHRQTEKQHRAREQYVQDAEYGGDGSGRRGGRREERQDGQQQEQREEREAEESSYRGDEIVPEIETVHPYNEYSWEVNQINPWLSACDLAGPAPADLQGSCGPPEVPKNCPAACVPRSRGNGDDTEFLEVTERSFWSAGEDAERSELISSEREPSGKRSDRRKSEGVRMAPEQCLFYLEESHKRDICRDDFGRTSTRSFLTPRENRYWFMSGLRLRHCCEHAVVNALAPGKGGPLENVLNGGQKCVDALDKLLLVDALAARLHCEFEEVLARYDCGQPYSVIFNCTHCKEAYRKWVCSSLVPYFAHGGPQDLNSSENSWTGSRLRPCRSFCQSVEQRCPYLLPGDRAPAYPTQYAGEPTFLCRDPNIPETGEQAARALHSSEEDECCFHACSEERPESGVCANCTDREPRKRGRSHDPPTAPHCEINLIQPASAGGQYPQSVQFVGSSVDGELEDDSSTSMSPTSMVQQQQQQQQQQQSASLCGSGGVGSMPSASSSGRSTASILPQLLWLCSVLVGFVGNVRTIPLLWISKMFARLVSVLGRGPRAERTSKLEGLVAWLHRCSDRVSRIGVRHGAKWPLEKWVMVERHCQGWWCWWWWWWRMWRRTSAGGRVRWKLRARRGPGRRFAEKRGPAAARVNESSRCSTKLRDTLRVCSSSSSRVCRWTRNFGWFAVKWRWWWWWLYRWWRSRRTARGRSSSAVVFAGDRGDEEARLRAAGRRGEVTEERRRRKGSLDGLEEDVWHSPAGRRYFRLSSRKDPP